MIVGFSGVVRSGNVFLGCFRATSQHLRGYDHSLLAMLTLAKRRERLEAAAGARMALLCVLIAGAGPTIRESAACARALLVAWVHIYV